MVNKMELVDQLYMDKYNVPLEEFEAHREKHENTFGYNAAAIAVEFAEIAKGAAKAIVNLGDALRRYFETNKVNEIIKMLAESRKHYEQLERQRIRAFNKLNFNKKKSQRRKWQKYKKKG